MCSECRSTHYHRREKYHRVGRHGIIPGDAVESRLRGGQTGATAVRGGRRSASAGSEGPARPVPSPSKATQPPGVVVGGRGRASRSPRGTSRHRAWYGLVYDHYPGRRGANSLQCVNQWPSIAYNQHTSRCTLYVKTVEL